MLKQFTIQNYKLFEKLSLKDIPSTLLISGQNNTGCTIDILNNNLLFIF